MDKLDEQIVNELLDDAKLPLRSIAVKLKVSFVTVMNRIKSLEKQGIIRNYSAKVDYEKAGFGVHAIIEMRITKGKMIELEQKIARTKEVYAVYDITGETDAIVIARFRNMREMDRFIKKIQGYEFVHQTNTKIVLNTIKEDSTRL